MSGNPNEHECKYKELIKDMKSTLYSRGGHCDTLIGLKVHLKWFYVIGSVIALSVVKLAWFPETVIK
jgi:hypothetical protein